MYSDDRIQKKIASIAKHREFTDEEWNLTKSTNTITDIYIAKARWALHCERCNVDHKKKKRVNTTVVLNRTRKRMKTVQHIIEETNNKKQKKRKKTEHRKRIEYIREQ